MKMRFVGESEMTNGSDSDQHWEIDRWCSEQQAERSAKRFSKTLDAANWWHNFRKGLRGWVSRLAVTIVVGRYGGRSDWLFSAVRPSGTLHIARVSPNTGRSRTRT